MRRFRQGRVIAADTRLSVLHTLLWRLLFGLFFLFCLIYPIAVVGVAFDVQPPFSLHWAGSVLLFLEGTLLILSVALIYGLLPALILSLLVFMLSYLVEAIGVNTGLPFGAYHYTDILFLHLPGDVPLAVMFAWILIVFGSYAWVRSDTSHLSVGATLLGALLATLLDMAIEPVAAHVVHYWEWSAPGSINYYGVPFANFVAWFLVTAGLLLLAGRFLTKRIASDRDKGTGLATFALRFLFITSLFMFGVVDLTHGYYVAVLLTILAGCLLFLRNERSRSVYK
ncbi:MAG: carotenoid biosynthesis protein [Ktedonobacteraceae bacterium]|nr:carotenoid biosynthesis protein [Ktedonobacteraceae bacterium]